MKKIIVFDKDDTITKAKCDIDENMANLLAQLSQKYKIAVITWWSFENIYDQIVSKLPQHTIFSNIYIFPTIGAQMYIFKNNDWERIYAEFLTDQEVSYIKKVLNNAIDELGLRPKKTYGEIIENRLTQITYSGLGQKAPYKEKQKFDTDKIIRQKIANHIKEKLKDYSIGIAWTTSIDVTRKGLDKAYGIRKIMENLGFKKEEILFVWDAIFPGGNDYSVKEFWVDCVKVDNLKDTESIIANFL